MYNLLISKKITYPKSETKWMSELELTQKEWRKIYSLPFKCTKDSKLLWLQYQLLHRILPINYYLHRVGIVNSSLCYFCQQTPETIEHIFVDCYLVKEFGLNWRNGRQISLVYKQVLINIQSFLENMIIEIFIG